MTKIIKYGISSSIKNGLRWKDGTPTDAQIGNTVRKGLEWFTNFWDVQLERTPKGSTIFLADDPRKYGNSITDWVFYAVKYNRIVFNPFKEWTLKGLYIAGPHELAHKYLYQDHVDWPDYPNGGSHVLKGGAATHYFESFSPREVEYGLKKGFRLNNRPVHPFCKTFAQNKDKLWREKNFDKLQSIVKSYGKYHAKLYKWQTEGR